MRAAPSGPVKLRQILQGPRIKPYHFKVFFLCQRPRRQSHIVFKRIQIKSPRKRMFFVCERGHFFFASGVEAIADFLILRREKNDLGARGRSL